MKEEHILNHTNSNLQTKGDNSLDVFTVRAFYSASGGELHVDTIHSMSRVAFSMQEGGAITLHLPLLTYLPDTLKISPRNK